MTTDIQKNINLAPYTTLKIGGAAKFFCEAKDEKEIMEALEFAQDKKLPVFLLGGGSNVLVSDKGFDGLVIKIQNSKFKIQNSSIECGAGVQLGKVVTESVKAGFVGMEWAAGIPGTVGGAVRGNAGAFGGEMAGAVESVNVLEILYRNPKSKVQMPNEIQSSKSKNSFQVSRFTLPECGFSYRSSVFKENPNLVILSAILKLRKGKREESEKKVKDIISTRKTAQPFDFPSSGSFFKNPKVINEELKKEYKTDTGREAENDIIPAGYLIDALGLRGKKIGGAMVSQHHGNFLVNAGNAKAEDFIILISLIKNKARNNLGVQLEEEIQYVGF